MMSLHIKKFAIAAFSCFSITASLTAVQGQTVATTHLNQNNYDIFNVHELGIGLTGPQYPLHVVGNGSNSVNTRLEGFSLVAGANASLMFDSQTNATYGQWGIEYNDVGSISGLNFWKPSESNGFGNYFLFLSDEGNVSIGTDDSEGYKLAVKGDVIAEKIVVKLHGDWPDFVFADQYELRSLSELEDYIEANSHLPNVPAASEVAEAGIDLGTMNAALLQKIEELTLYVIDLQKQVDALK